MAKSVPFTEARAGLSRLMDEVEQIHEHVVITRKGRPAAVLLAAAEYDSLQETLEVLSSDDTMEALRESATDVAAGRVQTLEEVRRELGLA